MKLNSVNICLLLALGTLQIPLAMADDLELQADNTPLLNTEGFKYVHSVEKSRFNQGIAAQRETEGPYLRVVGDKGVFMEDTVTGATLLVPNAVAGGPKSTAALRADLPQFLTDNPDKHSAAVKVYLLGAGIPANEVSGMHVTTTMGGGGPALAGVQPAESKLLWYTTHLERSLNGIPVEGSFAFATLDSQGKSFTEGVYWPAISAQVVRKAVALKRKLSSPAALQQFMGSAKAVRSDLAGAEAGEVKIVHTSAGHHGDFEAQAVYSLVVRNTGLGKAQIVRLDETGAPITLGDEVKMATKSVMKVQ
ncbi:hypothetical protein [Chitinimonas sp. BJB300]|uniref:hypothetical protein n=1 Tax=Chitinimonas sp. BJB300 TaxID=1559339 RepID=UPI000C0CA946|nr:hypothetical protein [Chitinimonas sp. BJB300]PHV12968.1 hypothetical protein CSQ89_03055 [Chitinimonas sp. BJB300]TSJ89079.1 hypothetical protein FG002_009405 [Chitinimonas sp. BJB300]